MTGPQPTSHPLELIAPTAPDGVPVSTAGPFGAALSSYLDAIGDVPVAPPHLAPEGDVAVVEAVGTVPPVLPLDIVARIAASASVAPSASPDDTAAVVPGPPPGPSALSEDSPRPRPAGAPAHVPQPPPVPLDGAVEPQPPPAGTPRDVVAPHDAPPTDEVGSRPPYPAPGDGTSRSSDGAREHAPPETPRVPAVGGVGRSAPPAGDPADTARLSADVVAAEPPLSTRTLDGAWPEDTRLRDRTTDAAGAPAGGLAGGRVDLRPATAAPAGTDQRAESPVGGGPSPSTAAATVDVARPLDEAASGAHATPGHSRQNGPTRSDEHAAGAVRAATRPVGDARLATGGGGADPTVVDAPDTAPTDAATVDAAAVDAAAGDAAPAAAGPAVPVDRPRATGTDHRRREPVVEGSARSEAPPEADGAGIAADGPVSETPGSSRVAAAPSARPPSEPIVNRIVALVERLRAEPPPRQMVVDLESLGAGRLVVTLRGDTVVVGPLNPGAPHDQQWLDDLDDALGARGWSLDHRRERSSPQDRRPRPPPQPWRTPSQPDHARTDDGLRL